jgi:FMN reductase
MSTIVVISAGLSVPSSTRLLADRIAAATADALEEVTLEVVELRPLAHAIADHLVTGFPSGELTEAISTVRSADGLIVVTPVFAASYSGLFKSFFDVLEEGVLDGKPVLIAATAGTARHSLVLDHALRPLFSYLHAVVVPTGVFAATDDFGDTGLDRRIERAAGELAALVGKVDPSARRRRTVDDEFDEPTPFEELLRRAEEG